MKRIVSILFIALLLLSLPALAQVSKEEIIYAPLLLTGEAKGVYVVNAFEATEETKVVDYGQYENVTNLSNDTVIEIKDDALSFTVPKGRMFVQGNLKDTALPWDIKIQFTLDGKEVSPEELSGVSGNIACSISLSPKDNIFARRLTLQMTVSLPLDKCFQIEAPKATAATAAGNKTLAYVVLPGQSATFDFSFDAENFSMPGIQIAGIAMEMDKDMYGGYIDSLVGDTAMGPAINTAMSNVLGQQQPPLPSFVDREKNTVQSVQFVMLTDEVPEKVVAQDKAPDLEAENSTLLERIKNLF
jgi:hypothetical protein